MFDHQAVQLAIRAHARTVSVATTGATSLAVSGSTYTRATGSFVTDGFKPGMELLASGFASATNNGLAVVTAVAATVLTVDRTLVDATASAGKTLSVGLPSREAWENLPFDPTPGAPWVREEFVSGPSRLISASASGTVEFDPLYHLHIYVPDNVGIGAHNKYADALLNLFKPLASIPLTSGDTIRVRTDASSYRGPVRHIRPGFASVRVTFPLRLYTNNA